MDPFLEGKIIFKIVLRPEPRRSDTAFGHSKNGKFLTKAGSVWRHTVTPLRRTPNAKRQTPNAERQTPNAKREVPNARLLVHHHPTNAPLRQ